MLSWLLLVLLIVVALGMLVWGVMARERFYQYPTIAGAAWLFYIVPQAVGTLRHPQKLPDAVLKDNALEIALGMCVLCALMGALGYACGKRSGTGVNQPRPEYSMDKLFLAGVVLCVIGYYGAYLLANLSGGFVAHFVRGGSYKLQWRGEPVMYVFISRLM